jgi:uncharacterized protein (TIGR02284 family)
MMLRDDKQTALNELIVTCKDAADRYHDSAQVTHDTNLSALFQRLGERRYEIARKLEDQLRNLGDLPRNPDSDLEAIESLVTRVKAALSPDDQSTLIEERERGEVAIGEKISAALATDLPPETQSLLRELSDEVASTTIELRAAKSLP